jgi:hypothetical protein
MGLPWLDSNLAIIDSQHAAAGVVSLEWPIGQRVAISNEMWPICLKTYN